MNPRIPDNVELIKGEIADYYIKDGVLYSLSKSVKRTVENISANIELVKKITGNKKMPLLIYLTPSPMPDAATRKLSTEKLPEIYSAMAMISRPGLAQFIMKLLFKLKTPPIPMKNFSNEQEALLWLNSHVVK